MHSDDWHHLIDYVLRGKSNQASAPYYHGLQPEKQRENKGSLLFRAKRYKFTLKISEPEVSILGCEDKLTEIGNAMRGRFSQESRKVTC